MAGSKQDAFSRLVEDLSVVLEPCSGLKIDEIDPQIIEDLMSEYKSKQTEWMKYAIPDFGRCYTRNLVHDGNGKSNLLVLVWTPGKGSPIHDHADSHCIMKILQGTLKETLYHWPEERRQGEDKEDSLRVKRETLYRTNEVAYMSDELGLHAMSNPDAEKPAVSLHLYTPPHAARDGCHIFDAATGKRSHVSQRNYFSEYGQKA